MVIGLAGYNRESPSTCFTAFNKLVGVASIFRNSDMEWP